MESVFRQQRREVVAGDAPRDVGELMANEILVALLEAFQPAIGLRAWSTLTNDALIFIVRCGADAHARAAVRQHLERVDVVRGRRPRPVEVRQDGMNTARVVADHSAQRAPLVRPRIRSERHSMRVRRVAQVVEPHTRLDPCRSRRWIDADDVTQIFRCVDDDGDVAALPGDARAGAACEHRRAMAAAHLHRADDVIDRLRNDDADWDLAVVR